eukprot:m.480326 g.480326  ORF g.480326 m.480326 type:complete len:403 (-) comp21791_c0_seq1:62-1270(-)
MFAPRFNPTKLKLTLKLAGTRLQMLQKKNENLGVLARKEIAKLLEKGKEEMARIKVEQIIRDDYLMETMEILEMFCALLNSRFGLIEAVKYCDAGILESVVTLIWSSPRIHDVPELAQIRGHFAARYGKEFVEEALENRNNSVHTGVIHKLSIHQPDPVLVDAYLKAIADKYKVDWQPDSGTALSASTVLPPAPVGGPVAASSFPSPPTQQQPSTYFPPPAGGTYQPQSQGQMPPQQSYQGPPPPAQSYQPPQKQQQQQPPPQQQSYQGPPPTQGTSSASGPPPAGQPYAGSYQPQGYSAGTDAGSAPSYTPVQTFGGAPPDNIAYANEDPGFPSVPGQGTSASMAPPPAASFDLPPLPSGGPSTQPPSEAPASSIGTASNASEVPDFDELTRRFMALKQGR